MAQQIMHGDIKKEESGALVLDINGDLIVTQDDDLQQVLLHAYGSFGNFLNYPTIGASLSRFLNAPLMDITYIPQAVADSLYLDGFSLIESNVNTGGGKVLSYDIISAQKITDITLSLQ